MTTVLNFILLIQMDTQGYNKEGWGHGQEVIEGLMHEGIIMH